MSKSLIQVSNQSTHQLITNIDVHDVLCEDRDKNEEARNVLG